MDKLQYDSLYKFLVSLGLVLIVLPFAALIYLFNVDPILISQIEYDALSEYSLQMIANRNELIVTAIKVFPTVGAISFVLGIFLAAIGFINWNRNQKKLDKKLDDETTVKTLNRMEMSSNEVAAKVEQEVNEAAREATGDINTSTTHYQKTLMAQYREIEDLCFLYFTKKYGRRYSLKRDIRMGKYDYDLICVSKKDDIDLLIEIKYWKDPTMVGRRLIDVCSRLNDACENYQTIAHRDFSGIVFIVIPSDQFAKVENTVDRFTERAMHGNSDKIVIKCISEDVLK